MLLLLLSCANRRRFAPFPLQRIACAAWRVAPLLDDAMSFTCSTVQWPFTARPWIARDRCGTIRPPRYNHPLAVATVRLARFARFIAGARAPLSLRPSALIFDQARSAQ
ncbi:hypothetical protein [Paraburkholderia xenovorans]